MDASPVSIKITLYTAVFSCVVMSALFLSTVVDTRTTVVFCDVGQGDGVYMRIKNKIDVVIDAGPDNSILECLGNHMPFFDRTIELAFITHPQKDHYFGFLAIGARYTIKTMFMNPLDSENSSFKELKEILEKNKTTVVFPYEGTLVEIFNSKFKFLWPTQKYIADNISSHTSTFSYTHNNQEKNLLSSYMGKTTLDPNLFSLIFTYEEKPAHFLFTGDSVGEILHLLLKYPEIKTTVLKVPHHGSKNGLTYDFLRLADPTLSVISVGRNNRYGHPSQEIISMFEKAKKHYIRTDIENSIILKIRHNMVERVK